MTQANETGALERTRAAVAESEQRLAEALRERDACAKNLVRLCDACAFNLVRLCGLCECVNACVHVVCLRASLYVRTCAKESTDRM